MKVYVVVYPDYDCAVYTDLKSLAFHISQFENPLLGGGVTPTEENLDRRLRGLGVTYIYQGTSEKWYMRISKLEI